MKLFHAVMISSLFATTAYAFAPRLAGSAVARSFGASAAVQSSQTMMRMSAAPADMVKSEIASNDVVVFSKSYCPFCTATKGLMQDLKIDAKVIELDEVPNGAELQAALLDISGQRTVPNVFVKGSHLGGNDDTQAAARTGKLQDMLK